MTTVGTELEGVQNGSLWLQAPRSCFDVGVVPAGGIHVLRRFRIRNLAQEDAVLHLQSQRPRLVSFQHDNPNLELDVPNEAFNTIDLFRYSSVPFSRIVSILFYSICFELSR